MRVAIELTGPLARTIRVAVDGRAQVVDDFGGLDPTSTIRLDGLLLARLAGGAQTTRPASNSTATQLSVRASSSDSIS